MAAGNPGVDRRDSRRETGAGERVGEARGCLFFSKDIDLDETGGIMAPWLRISGVVHGVRES